MLETTSAMNLFAPMVITVMVSRFVANKMTPSMYNRAIQNKGLPVLPRFVPKAFRDTQVSTLMCREVSSVPSLCTVKELKRAIS